MDDQDHILSIALDWAREGRKVALATVVATFGSAPRPVGARLAIDEAGRFEGSVSSGCVEAEVIAASEDVLATGQPMLLAFGPTTNPFAVALTCGGMIKIFVEALTKPQSLRRRLDDARQGRASASLLDLATGVRADPETLATRLDESDLRLLSGALHRGEPVVVETKRGAFFLEFWRPSLRLDIIGAVHIAQSLAPLGALAGYEVTVIDPRLAFADAARFPGQRLVTRGPEEHFAQHPPDALTAVVALSHEARFDDPALIAALNSDAFYVGALGSCASAEKRRQRLHGKGVDEAALARLRGPAGLAIGAQSPAEIAISIAAEMTQALRGAVPALLLAAAQ